MAGKQAKIFSNREILQVLNHIKGTRYPLRDRVMFLLSIKAGLRAKEISFLTWGMITDASGRYCDKLQEFFPFFDKNFLSTKFLNLQMVAAWSIRHK
jgi:hypothetical protein